MKFFPYVIIVTSLAFGGSLFAQEQKARTAKIPTVETKWPGINFVVSRLQRIQGDRLLVVVRVIATLKAPRSGTFLGTKPEIPPSATERDLAAGLYNPKPFSLASAVMIDDQTQRKYSVLPAVAPPGKMYFPGELANILLPGQAETLAIQFAAPPAPPPVEGREPPKQTVTFLLTGAKGPIARVPIPSAPTEE